MSGILRKEISLPSTSLSEEEYYRELTSRNFHFVSPETQAALSRIDILIAGCGSTGGACIEALARAGVRRFRLADNGAFDVSNLNRQHARLEAVGKNKALFHADEIRAIQPWAEIATFPEGLTEANLELAVRGATLVMDAVDVTTRSGLEMKIRLHEECAKNQLPVFTALDLGYRQWGESFDYRDPSLAPFNGRAENALRKSHPISALFTLYPLSAVPDHALGLVDDLLHGRIGYASQLGATSDLLSSIIVAATIRYVESGDLIPGWNVDLWEMKEGRPGSVSEWIRSRLAALRLRASISRRIRLDLARGAGA